MSAKTLGWVGFGISPNGGMKGSDMVIGWVDPAADVFVLVSNNNRNNGNGSNMHEDILHEESNNHEGTLLQEGIVLYEDFFF